DALPILVERLVRDAEGYVVGQKLEPKAAGALQLVEEALDYFVRNTFSKLNYLQHRSADPQKEIQSLLSAPPTIGLDLESTGEANPRALKAVSQQIELLASQSQRIVLHDLVEVISVVALMAGPKWKRFF